MVLQEKKTSLIIKGIIFIDKVFDCRSLIVHYIHALTVHQRLFFIFLIKEVV